MRIRDVIKTIEPYQWEPSSEMIAAEQGLKLEKVVRFDTSTSPFIPSKWLSSVSENIETSAVNDYPDTSYSRLVRLLSSYVGKPKDHIVPTNGSDEALDLVGKLLLDKGSELLVSAPTYSLYSIIGQVMGSRIVPVPRKKGFVDDCDRLLDTVSEKTRLILLCSPNNPTGNTVSEDTLIRLLEETGCAVAVDEAYYEFCGKTFVDLTDRYENLIVIRTMSKAFGLAGARVGYIVAHRETTDNINKIRPPNSLSVISLMLAETALRDLNTVRRNTRVMVDEKERCFRVLKKLGGLTVYPSEANFLLVRFKHPDGNTAYRKLLAKGFVTRNFSNAPMLKNCLRIGMRLPEQNDALLKAIAGIVGD
ncbi:MAG: histidinol-phosphate transaminase [Thaumarchaeota archaeon]|nr:histidinol-phosphate transaminase [Nitrososphaerota archaeon]